MDEHSYSLGFNPYKQPQPITLNVKNISFGPLKFVNPHLIYFDHKNSFDTFTTDDALAEYLGVYDDLPPFHHNRGFLY